MSPTTATPIRLLIVEDEPLYARLLSTLAQTLGYEVVGPVATGEEALALYQQLPRPDLALLDINLAGALDGVELGHELLDVQALPLIFVTSLTDEDTFTRAKALGPAAYLLKPFDERALQLAIELALHNFATGDAPATYPAPAPAWNEDLIIRSSLFLRDRGRLTKVNIADIRYVEAGDKYSTVIASTGKFTARISLRDLIPRLLPARFIQVHRSYLVNVDHIECIDQLDSTVTVAKTELPLGPSYREPLLKILRLVG
jgi:DNA-binding LytR/AlgR family response regulator